MRGSRDRWRLVGAVLGVSLLLILAAAVSGCGSGAAKSAWGDTTPGDQTAGTGKPAPAFSGVTLDGKTVIVDQYRGKPLLLVYMTGT